MIDVTNVTKTYATDDGRTSLKALDKISLSVRSQEFVALLGPSGCGKTTLLKIIGGLMAWDAGQVSVNGKPVTGPGQDRAIVFQNFALLPWADVLTNVAFGLELQGMPKSTRETIAKRLIAAVGLSGFEQSYPRHLSGGMQQRVGLARALAVDPQILLLDEPFGALDAQTRRLLEEDLLRLHEKQPKTIILVTHNMAEAVRLADRVVLMSPRPGQIKEIIDIPFGRPRPEGFDRTPQFLDLKEYLWENLKAMHTKSNPLTEAMVHSS